MTTEAQDHAARFDELRAHIGRMEEVYGQQQRHHERTLTALAVYRDDLEREVKTLSQKLRVATELYAAACGITVADATASVDADYTDRKAGNGLDLTIEQAAALMGLG